MATFRENFCAKSFDRYLAHQLDGPMPCWLPVPPGKDPPDFLLTLDNETYAVEVTSTQVLREPSIGKSSINEETYEETHREIVNLISSVAQTQGLKGRYVISFDQPIASTNFQKVKKHFMTEVVASISRSQTLPVSWSEPVRYQDKELCHLFKVGEGDLKFFETFSTDFTQTDSHEFRTFVTEMLRNVVHRKKELIEVKGISEPVILLLLNTYGLADSEVYNSCVEQIQERDVFCAIFIIQPDGSGCMIHSKQPTWTRGSRVNAA